MTNRSSLSRREALCFGLAAGTGWAVAKLQLAAQVLDRLPQLRELPLVTKAIPSSGERLPVIGLGTAHGWGSTPRAQLAALLRRMPELGGTVVDTAPAYGQSEIALGDLVNQLGIRDRMFLATKVSLGWFDFLRSRSAEAAQGVDSLEASMRQLRTTRLDLVNVWNLSGPDVLLPILREWKQAGRIRYYGVTTTSKGQYRTLLDLMRRETLDFIEIDYAINDRDATNAVLPLAADRGIAVLTAEPFGQTSVFTKVRNKPVPGWAKEIDCTTWAQIFLKYLVSHPAVTVAIPETTSVDHLTDNLAAARGRLPDAAMRQRIEREYDTL